MLPTTSNNQTPKIYTTTTGTPRIGAMELNMDDTGGMSRTIPTQSRVTVDSRSLPIT
ncbi:MAG: hypothetical protein ACI8P9_004008 [Parasphingorhabdus sp.]|jgi:hypothetical protein